MSKKNDILKSYSFDNLGDVYMASSASINLDFEQAIGQLKDVVTNMEKDDLTLNAALACYEKGVALTKHCQDLLNSAEQTVKQLLQDKNKEWLSAFNSENNEQS